MPILIRQGRVLMIFVKILRNTLLFCVWMCAAIVRPAIILPTVIIVVIWLCFRAYFIRAYYYARILLICSNRGYMFDSNFFAWIFSTFNRPDPEMFILKDGEVLSVKNYGRKRKNVSFTFYSENKVRLTFTPPFLIGPLMMIKDFLMIDEEHVIPSINTSKVYGRFDGKPVRDIIVFCPGCLQVSMGGSELNKGDKLYDKYEVYNIKSFIKICLAGEDKGRYARK